MTPRRLRYQSLLRLHSCVTVGVFLVTSHRLLHIAVRMPISRVSHGNKIAFNLITYVTRLVNALAEYK